VLSSQEHFRPCCNNLGSPTRYSLVTTTTLPLMTHRPSSSQSCRICLKRQPCALLQPYPSALGQDAPQALQCCPCQRRLQMSVMFVPKSLLCYPTPPIPDALSFSPSTFTSPASSSSPPTPPHLSQPLACPCPPNIPQNPILVEISSCSQHRQSGGPKLCGITCAHLILYFSLLFRSCALIHCSGPAY